MPAIHTKESDLTPALLVGRRKPLSDAVELRAGPVSALLYEGDLRHVRIGDAELLQRVYMAVRDEVWNTIPGTIEDLRIESRGEDGFEVSFDERHRYGEIDFGWRARIRGEADGTITYEMAGTAASAFRYAKIGLNVHHPLRECLGRPYRAYLDGQESRGVLPSDIEPQLFRDGTLTALFPPYDALVIELGEGREVRFDFEGDLFEMQDHRNWTDANLKSYGTPLSLPWPFTAKPGDEIRQSVRIGFSGPAPAPAEPAGAIQIRIGEPGGRTLPPIGFGLPTTATGSGPEAAELEAAELDLLRAAAPAHLRVDVVLDEPGAAEAVARTAAVAASLGSALELAIFTGTADPSAVRPLAEALARAAVPVARAFVYTGTPGFSSTSGSTTPAALVRAVRDELTPHLGEIPCAGGTCQFFNELNRNRPETEGVDGVVYSLNPQVHASDDLSLMENLAAQPDTVAMTRKLTDGLPVFVSPVTLIGPYGPFPGGPPAPGGLPGNVDVRQFGLFGAAWTLASVRRLSEAQAAAITYFQTDGLRGVLQGDRGRREGAPELPVPEGAVFPLYHVFADLASLRPARLLEATSGDAAKVEVLALAGERDQRVVLLANLTPQPQAVAFDQSRPGEVASVRVLDASVAELAMREPVRFRDEQHAVRLGSDERFELQLAPYAIARIDLA